VTKLNQSIHFFIPNIADVCLVLQPHLVDHEDLVILLGNLLPTIRNIAAAVVRVDLPHSKAVLMTSPAYVERVVILVESSLDSPSRNMTIAGIHPGQVAVTRSHQDIILFLAMLLASPGNIATVVLWVHLAWIST